MVYEDEFLLEQLNNFIIELGRMPTKKEIETTNKVPSYTSYYQRFGGLTKLAKKLGVEMKTRGKWNKKELNNQIVALIVELRRIPTERDLKNTKGAPNPEAPRNHFGKGWQKRPLFIKKLIKRLEKDLENNYFDFDINGYWKCNTRGKYVVEPYHNGDKIYVCTCETEKQARRETVKFRLKNLKELVE